MWVLRSIFAAISLIKEGLYVAFVVLHVFTNLSYLHFNQIMSLVNIVKALISFTPIFLGLLQTLSSIT